jgi:hypothetical protein
MCQRLVSPINKFVTTVLHCAIAVVPRAKSGPARLPAASASLTGAVRMGGSTANTAEA